MIKISCLLYFTVAFSLVCMILTSCSRPAHYKNDGKQVTWQGRDIWGGPWSEVVDADPATFEDLGNGYARDDQKAFLEGKIIKGADGRTFKCLEQPYAVDASHVFHKYTMMTGADPKSFMIHGQYLTEDENDYFWCGKPIHVSDKKTFVIIGDKDNEFTHWAKDKNNAYYMGEQPVPLADYDSFHVIKETDSWGIQGHYAADKYRVYYKDHIVEGADPETFTEIIDWVGQDKHRVYYQWKATDIKDYNQLSHIGGFYSDGSHIYTHEFEMVEDADARTFRQFGSQWYGYGSWYVDKDHVWWREKHVVGMKEVKEADAATFQLVQVYNYSDGTTDTSESFAKDKSHVFYRGSIIPGADPATFEIIDIDGSLTTFDKNRIYEGENSKELQKYLKDKYGSELKEKKGQFF